MTDPARRSGRRKTPGSPPAVDKGNPPGPLRLLARELRPAPGRLANTLRVTLLCLVAIGISEVFRTPLTVLTAALVFFMSTKDMGSSILTAVMMTASAVAGVFIALLVFCVSLSEPALRVPLIAVATFAAMFLSRASSLGPVFFVSGFVTAYALTFGDDVLGAALQPDTAGDTTEDGLPALAFMPPVEALVHSILWIAVAVGIPALVVIVGNLLIGRDPTLMLRSALANRMAAAARYCEGSEGAVRDVETLARAGLDPLLKLRNLAAKLHRTSRLRPPGERVILDVGRLLGILLAWERVARYQPADALASAAAACRAIERAIRRGGVVDAAAAAATPTGDDQASGSQGVDLARPLREELRQVLGAMLEELSPRSYAGSAPSPRSAPSSRRLFADDAFSNPDHVRFALKVTLAMMGCYIFKDLAHWSGIQTCIVTCFLVAMGTIGESTHKAALRLAGACIGGALGIGAILFVMPSADGVGGLIGLLTPVLLISAWVASGSERTAYCGMQIALGFAVSVLQGYGPTLDMQTARDRIFGVLLGDAAILAVFTTIWPVNVDDMVRERLADALDRLADLVALPLGHDSDHHRAGEDQLRRRVGLAIAEGRAVLVDHPYETEGARPPRGRRPIDSALLSTIQDLIVPVSVIIGDRRFAAAGDRRVPSDDPPGERAHRQALSGWFRRCARWVRTGVGGPDVTSTLPEPPPGEAGWYGILHGDLRAIIETVGPSSADGDALRMTGPRHARA